MRAISEIAIVPIGGSLVIWYELSRVNSKIETEARTLRLFPVPFIPYFSLLLLPPTVRAQSDLGAGTTGWYTRKTSVGVAITPMRCDAMRYDIARRGGAGRGGSREINRMWVL